MKLTQKQVYQRLLKGTIAPDKVFYEESCGRDTCRVEVAWQPYNDAPAGEVSFPDGSRVTFDAKGKPADWAVSKRAQVKQATTALWSAMRTIAKEQAKKPRLQGIRRRRR